MHDAALAISATRLVQRDPELLNITTHCAVLLARGAVLEIDTSSVGPFTPAVPDHTGSFYEVIIRGGVVFRTSAYEDGVRCHDAARVFIAQVGVEQARACVAALLTPYLPCGTDFVLAPGGAPTKGMR